MTGTDDSRTNLFLDDIVPAARGRPSDDPRSAAGSDPWYEWLLHRRSGNDPIHDQLARAEIERYADRVLDGAKLAPDMILADIGTGEGLVAFRAIDRIGASLSVILTDISAALLNYTETLAEQRGVKNQCSFLQCSADRLNDIQDASVDAVTTRSVLAYVADKPAALREFHRILKPGGRLSMAEPVFVDDAFEVVALKDRIDRRAEELSPSQDRLLRLMHRWKSSQYPDTLEKMARNPITSCTERDLFRLVNASGFAETRLELHLESVRKPPMSWQLFLDITPHPLAKPLRAILAEQFTPDEREFFEKALRPSIEVQQFSATNRMAYLTAQKPLP